MTDQRKARLKRCLQEARFRLLNRQETLALPLRGMFFVATKAVRRISTNGACIYFDPDWLQKLGEDALDFILAHQLMHLALGHTERPKFYKGERFHLACDIVANSHLMAMGLGAERFAGIGTVYSETFFPQTEGRLLSAVEALHGVPFDPADLSPARRRSYMIDSEEWWDRREDRGAGGVIVLSPADEDPPDLVYRPASSGRGGRWKKERFEKKTVEDTAGGIAEGEGSGGRKEKESWEETAKMELPFLRGMRTRDRESGAADGMTERAWLHPNTAGLNWKLLLNSIVQEEIRDYSFTPPDRRMQESGFFLPDYHIETETPKEVYLMVDTSGSVEDEALTRVYGELVGALEQFRGGLIGRLGFFDLRVYPLLPFADPEDLARIVPRGGGGTDFQCVFDCLDRLEKPPSGVVIFTDGRGDFPKEPPAYPTLWILTDKKATPPWGRTAYL